MEFLRTQDESSETYCQCLPAFTHFIVEHNYVKTIQRKAFKTFQELLDYDGF